MQLSPTIAVVAGGPSLLGFAWDSLRLPGVDVVAVNLAFRPLPFARLLWWSDQRFFRWHEDALRMHGAEWKATARLLGDREPYPPWVTTMKFTGERGYDPAPGCLKHGNTSTYAAMHVSASAGARRIAVFGLDMRRFEGKPAHWHEDHLIQGDAGSFAKMLVNFDSLAKEFLRMRIDVVNASPESALAVFPRVSHEEALAWLAKT